MGSYLNVLATTTFLRKLPSMYQVLDQSLSYSPNNSSQAKQNAACYAISIADSSSPSSKFTGTVASVKLSPIAMHAFVNNWYFVCFDVERKLKHLEFLLCKQGRSL